MPHLTREARESLRSLLLPVNEVNEDTALKAAMSTAEEEGLNGEDFPIILLHEAECWRSEGEASALLKKIVKSAIAADGENIDRRLSAIYFQAHKKLQSKEYMLNFSQATAILSHARLAIALAQNSRATASQIARLLNARDSRVGASRQSVLYLLNRLTLAVEMTEEQTLTLFEADAALSQKIFADADLSDCSSMVGDVAERLGCSREFADHLSTLAPLNNLSSFTPYLQILHYQCTVSEHFDFATKDMYEFNPRGRAALALFEKYPESLRSAGNPFLNNAKSVEQLTISWARSKKAKLYAGAIALYWLLDTLQSLGFSARRELASWVRIWIHRVILLASQDVTPLPDKITEEQAQLLINFVKARNTQTSGVVEQRVVDAISVARHPNTALWKSRGLKDSVNATNISRKKLGDCDFQNSNDRKVVAYEAHGGKLSQIYFEEHIRTLKKILPSRIQEWETFSEIPGWKVDVVFIAHEVAEGVEVIELEFQGVNISVSSTTFEEILGTVALEILATTLSSHVLEVLSTSRVPESIRVKVKDVINS